MARLTARLAALEGRPEEAAHFSALARLPTAAAVTTFGLRLSDLVPARLGDTLKAGETVAVSPAAPLPDGLNLLTATVPADGTVLLRFSAIVTVPASAAPVLWNVVALR